MPRDGQGKQGWIRPFQGSLAVVREGLSWSAGRAAWRASNPRCHRTHTALPYSSYPKPVPLLLWASRVVGCSFRGGEDGSHSPKKGCPHEQVCSRGFTELWAGQQGATETKSSGPGAGPFTAISFCKHPPVRANYDQGETRGNKERF